MRVALIGYGKMGHIIEQVLIERGHSVCCIIDKDNLSDFSSEAFALADAAIEFSTPQTAEQNIRCCWQHNIPVVSGTTGWDVEPLINEVKNNGQTFCWTSNFSVGVNLFFMINEHLAKLMSKFQYEPSIKEIHHIHKLDAPSGTAKTLRDIMLAQGVGMPIAIESVREGEVPGTHIVRYENRIDSIELRHDAKSREGFALGAVIAAEFIVGKKGFYSMKEILFNN